MVKKTKPDPINAPCLFLHYYRDSGCSTDTANAGVVGSSPTEAAIFQIAG
jgi:hypothetical protein